MATIRALEAQDDVQIQSGLAGHPKEEETVKTSCQSIRKEHGDLEATGSDLFQWGDRCLASCCPAVKYMCLGLTSICTYISYWLLSGCFLGQGSRLSSEASGDETPSGLFPGVSLSIN